LDTILLGFIRRQISCVFRLDIIVQVRRDMMPNYIYYLDTPELIDLHHAVGLFFFFFPSILVLRHRD